MYASVKFSVSSAIKGFRVKWQLHHLQGRTGYPTTKLLLWKSRNAFFTMYVKLVCLFIQCHLSASSNCSLFSALLSISTSPANEMIKETVTMKVSWLKTIKSVRVSESKCLPFSVLLCENLLQATIANVSMNYYLKLQHYHYFQTRDRRCLTTTEAFSKKFCF